MRIYAHLLATFCAIASLVTMSEKSLAQGPDDLDDLNSSPRVLTVRGHRDAYVECGTIGCGPNRPTSYESDADALDPFSNCVSGCDVDTIFRALTGRQNAGWKR